MPIVRGYDYFEGVALADASEQRWAAIVESCDPLLRGAVLVGISATQAGVERAHSGRAAEILEAGALLDESRQINGELVQELGLRRFPRADHLELAHAGLCIVSAAAQTTELLRNYPIENEDYTGQTGARFIMRATLAPVQTPELSLALGRTLSVRPVRNVQARVFAEDSDSNNHGLTELTLAASLHGSGHRSSSMSSVLRTIINGEGEQDIASAQITAGYRQGDFVLPVYYVNFSNLSPYAWAIESLRLSNAH